MPFMQKLVVCVYIPDHTYHYNTRHYRQPVQGIGRYCIVPDTDNAQTGGHCCAVTDSRTARSRVRNPTQQGTLRTNHFTGVLWTVA